jgi:SAM-dependent methyltransferase
LIDVAEVIDLARVELAEFGGRARFVPGDARQLDLRADDARADDARETEFDIAIVANVLHLHAPDACAELCASALRAVRPGGLVAIVDLRRGTLEGEMFALNMALYTDGGSVYTVDEIGGWLRAAGGEAIEERRLESAPEMVVVLCKAALQA